MKNLTLLAFLLLTTRFFSLAQLPVGFIAKYELPNTAVDNGGNNYNGTLTSTTGTTDRFGTVNAATNFTTAGTGTLPVALVTATQNNFTFGFWFKTTQVAGFDGQWYGGRALVDAEVCGETFDWGFALIDGGAVAFGIGLPDITIKSPLTNYNNNAWHFVTGTRNATGGIIILYIDGVQVATSAGTTTSALNAPTSIRLGSNPCAPAGVYVGALDDMVVYDRALSAAEVTSLYNHLNALTLPLQWLSFTGELQGNKVELIWEVDHVVNNDRFEIEHSLNGNQFSTRAVVPEGAGIVQNAGRHVYRYSDLNVAKGNHSYRIKQIDEDGKSTFSKTIQVNVGANLTALALKANPVNNELLIQNSELALLLRLQVLDVNGKVLIDHRVQSTDAVVRLDVRKLKPGYYLLKVNTKEGFSSLPWIKL
ncbi:MAG: T9SS type A sorting domain-containing protein [Chitinophagaceae bacterium]|nr:T9SS type A sorting domain-containing protein [Chitinophagaceae bacterium]